AERQNQLHKSMLEEQGFSVTVARILTWKFDLAIKIIRMGLSRRTRLASYRRACLWNKITHGCCNLRDIDDKHTYFVSIFRIFNDEVPRGQRNVPRDCYRLLTGSHAAGETGATTAKREGVIGIVVAALMDNQGAHPEISQLKPVCEIRLLRHATLAGVKSGQVAQVAASIKWTFMGPGFFRVIMSSCGTGRGQIGRAHV